MELPPLAQVQIYHYILLTPDDWVIGQRDYGEIALHNYRVSNFALSVYRVPVAHSTAPN